jgi:hypothetical protein
VYRLSFVGQTIAWLLLPARSRKNIRQELQGVCQGVEIVEMQKAGRLMRPAFLWSLKISN